MPQLALAQAELGHEVTVWCADGHHLSVPELGQEPVNQIIFHIGTIGNVINSPCTYNIVHDHGIWLPFHRNVSKLCQQYQVPLVISPRGMLEPWSLRHKRIKKKLAWWLYQKKCLQSADALHATAAAEANQLINLGFEKSIIIHPNGVDVPIAKSEADLGSVQEQKAKTALFIGRIHPKKGLSLLIEAWRQVGPENWRVRIIGPDELGHRADLEDQVKKAGLAGIWSFTGPLEGSAKWQAMREADLFILPTHSENFGIVVAEALAAGLPVITTTGAPWAGLRIHECGWWVAPEISALATALLSATRLPAEDLRKMGKRGLEWVKEEFAWPRIARAMLQSYEDIIGNIA